MIRRQLEKWMRLPGPAVQLATERFVLRTLTRNEAAQASYPWRHDVDVLEGFESMRGNWSPLAWRRRTSRPNNRTRFTFGITLRDTGEIIGIEMVNISRTQVATLGVIIGERDWWGRQVVVESRTAVLDFLFSRTDCARAWGTVRARNLPSVANYLSLGFRHEGTLRNHFLRADGSRADAVVFGMLREEWLARRRPENAAPGGPAP